MKMFEDFRNYYKSSNPYHITSFDDMSRRNGIITPQSSLTPYIVKEAERNMMSQDIFSLLLENRILFMGQEFSDEAANVMIAQLMYLNQLDKKGKIEIEINSPGGSIIALRGILSIMEAIDNPIATTCVGMAASCASVLLTCGTPGMRRATKYSYILVHQALSSTGNRMVQCKDLTLMAQHTAKLNDDIAETFVRTTGLAKDKVLEAMDRDNWIEPERAIPGREWGPKGLIDEIVTKI